MAVDKKKVAEIIDKIRPQLQMDGGDIQLIDVSDDGVVKVQLQGACVGCAHAQQTLKLGVERALKQFEPSIKEVISV
jgi:Fe-S cluster biogenesis protein NfuA